MCETAIQASGKFLLRKTKDGKYRLSFTLFYDDSTSAEHLQARQIVIVMKCLLLLVSFMMQE